MKVEFKLNNTGKAFIQDIIKKQKFDSPIDQYKTKKAIEKWCDEDQTKVYFIRSTKNKNKIKSFVLIHEEEDDPFNLHTCPYVLDYIYTFKKKRRKGFAFHLINHIRLREQITTFCSSDSSKKLFLKAKYKFYGHDTITGNTQIYRYP